MVMIADVPFFPQEEYQCGPAALATMLSFTGIAVNSEDLVDDVYLPRRNGSLQVEMTAAARSHGRLSYRIDPYLDQLISEVEAGNPVLVLQNLGLRISPQWHFAVVKGVDLTEENLILNSGSIENYSLSLKVFERTWARAEYWAVVITSPGSIPATASAQNYFLSMVDLEHSYDNTDELKLAYASGVSRWPGNRDLLMAYGNLLLTSDEPLEAAAAYRQVIDHYPQYSPALNNLAHTLHKLGQSREALVYAEQAIRWGDGFNETYQKTYHGITESVQ
ncbi:MAG: hypothetical protein DHS20C12_00880 [Pseudohongiella sp.]|nr:MAG: hypothetical protein DHS20C12_00880 [Pseudohongiella sp.]